MIKKAENDAVQTVEDSKVQADDLIKQANSDVNDKVFNARESASHEAENIIAQSVEEAKKEANHIKTQSQQNVDSIKSRSTGNVDQAASVIVEKLL